MPQEYLCTVKYACKNDDERLIRTPGIAYGRRIGWIYKIIKDGRWYCESKEALLEIVAEKEEDVWLWVDGDEAALPEPDELKLDKLPYALAAKSLQMRQAFERFESQETAATRRRVQSTSLEVRLAAILWLVLTSKAAKKVVTEYGFMDMEEWDLSTLVVKWWDSLCDVNWQDWLPGTPTEEFERAMEKEGHTCHSERWLSRYNGPKMVGQWLYVQSVLFPERAGVPVNLMHRDWHDKEIHCDACRSYVNQHYSQCKNIFYEPSPCSALLAFVHDHIYVRAPSFPEWIAALSSRCDYRKLTSAGRQLCQTIQPKLKRQSEDWDARHAPWINSYPRSWLHTLSKHSSRTWKLVDSILGSLDLSSEIETTPDFATWLAAAMWTIPTDDQSFTVGRRVGVLESSLKYAIKKLDLLLHPPNTDIVESFRCKISNSSHTCWNGHDPGWYACAVSYLNDDDDPDFVPYLDPYNYRDPTCKECRLINQVDQFAKRLSNSFRPGDEFSDNLASMNAQFQALDRVSGGGACLTGVGNAESDEQPSTTDNEDVEASVHLTGTSIAPDIIPQMTTLERTLQSIDTSSYEADLYNVASDHLSVQGFQPTLLHDTSQPISLQGTWQNNLLSDPPPTSVSQPQQDPQSIGPYESIQTTHQSLPAFQNIVDYGASTFGFRNISPNPPSYNDISSTYDPPVSLEFGNTQTIDGSHQTSQAVPPGPLPQSRTRTKGSRLKKAAVIQEVKQYIIKSLRARLNKFKDEYTLPWTQLEQNLKEWRIEMINWPEGVERDDPIKGIYGLNNRDARSLWNAIQNPDLGKRLQFCRLGSSVEEGRSRKRRGDALDGDNPEDRSHPSKSQRLDVNGQCSQIIWDSTTVVMLEDTVTHSLP